MTRASAPKSQFIFQKIMFIMNIKLYCPTKISLVGLSIRFGRNPSIFLRWISTENSLGLQPKQLVFFQFPISRIFHFDLILIGLLTLPAILWYQSPPTVLSRTKYLRCIGLHTTTNLCTKFQPSRCYSSNYL
jgi:hypothetical protein